MMMNQSRSDHRADEMLLPQSEALGEQQQSQLLDRSSSRCSSSRRARNFSDTQTGCENDDSVDNCQNHAIALKHKKVATMSRRNENHDNDDITTPLLLLEEDDNNEHHHIKQPSSSSRSQAIFILLFFGALERGCYYGTMYTQTSFLEGMYDENWSPDVNTRTSLEITSLTVTLAFTYPFIGAILADSLLGNYWTILIGSVFFYLPGFLLIALVSKPYLLGQSLPVGVLYFAYLFLFTFGAGSIKPCINIMGAQQFRDSVHQKRDIQSYYINSYIINDSGAALGGVIIPAIVEMVNPFTGYMIATVTFAFGLCVFILGSGRLIKMAPTGKENLRVIAITGRAICGLQGLEQQRQSAGGRYPDALICSVKQLAAIVPITTLTVPFNIVYSQMRTTFVAQGNVMAPAAFVDSAWMQNFESFAVVLAGTIIKGCVYPCFEKRNGKAMKLSTKFAIGTAFGTLSMLSAIVVDLKIANEFIKSGQAINILWQVPSFVFIGFGEIFAISASYEAAFLVGPKNLKALTSAVNLFLGGAVPAYILHCLFWICSHWFEDPDGNTKLHTLDSYVQAHTVNFLTLVLGITVIAIVINLMPVVDRFLLHTLAKADNSNNNAQEDVDGEEVLRRKDVVHVLTEESGRVIV